MRFCYAGNDPGIVSVENLVKFERWKMLEILENVCLAIRNTFCKKYLPRCNCMVEMISRPLVFFFFFFCTSIDMIVDYHLFIRFDIVLGRFLVILGGWLQLRLIYKELLGPIKTFSKQS